MEELPKTEVTPSKLSIGIGFVIHLLEKNRKKVKSRDIWREWAKKWQWDQSRGLESRLQALVFTHIDIRVGVSAS